MIEKIELPDKYLNRASVDFYITIEVLNRIIDGLNEIDGKLTGALCTCPDPIAIAHNCPIHSR